MFQCLSVFTNALCAAIRKELPTVPIEQIPVVVNESIFEENSLRFGELGHGYAPVKRPLRFM